MDISKLFELEIAQWAGVDLRVAPRLVDDAACGENQDAGPTNSGSTATLTADA